MSKERKHPLNATGDLERRVRQWWADHMTAPIVAIHVKGDGGVRVWWDDGEDDGGYWLPFTTLYAALTPAPAPEGE